MAKATAAAMHADLLSNAGTLKTDVFSSKAIRCHVDKLEVHKQRKAVEGAVFEAHGLVVHAMHSGLPQQTASQRLKRDGVGLQSVFLKPGRVCESEAWQVDAIAALRVVIGSVGAWLGARDCTACKAGQC